MAGLAPPCVAVKDRLIGLAPITGVVEGGGVTGAGVEGGDINCANPGVSAARLLIDRPLALPFPEVEELPVPAAANGVVLVGAVPAAVAPEVVAEVGARPTVARGTVGPTLLINDDGSLD